MDIAQWAHSIEGFGSIKGVGKGFAPSATAAANATGVRVQQSEHPSGVAGTRFSLEKMAEFIRNGRNDFRMRGWAGKVVMAAGKPKTVRGQVQALLNEIRKVTFYTQDPVGTEKMVRPDISLCLDPTLCVPAVDCDDRCIILGSATLALGIDTRILGQAYGTDRATHVILAVQDESGNWLKVDPSSENYDVGQSYPATKEWVMDPISGRMEVDGKVIKEGKEPVNGDFIGVGAVPVPKEGVGAIPFAHAFSPLAHNASYVPVGQMGGCTCFPEDRKKKPDELAFGQSARFFK